MRMKRILFSFCLALILLVSVVSVALAVPGSITNLVANPTTTTITLTWILAPTSNSTVIRYSTSGFPATPAGGTSAYSGTGYQTTLSSLTAGTSYFFSAWGYDGSNYSDSPAQVVMSTLAVNIPSGAESTPDDTLPAPSLPANINQAPSVGAFSLEPFTSMITWFNSAPGGLGMPVANAWGTIFIYGLVAVGILTYAKTKQFFIAYMVVFLGTVIGVGLNLTQGYLVAFEIIIGMGVWAIERASQ